MDQPTLQPPPVIPATPGRRLASGLIDVLVVLVAGVIYTLIFGSNQPKGAFSMTVNDKVVNNGGAWAFVGLTLVAFYLAEVVSGKTIGKQVTGLRVAMADGQPPTPGAIFMRTLLRPIDGVPFIIPNLLGFITVASSKRNQRIGDMVAGTIVTSADRTGLDLPTAPLQ